MPIISVNIYGAFIPNTWQDEEDGDENEEYDDVKNVDDEERWRPDLLLGLSTAVKSVPELGELRLIDSLVPVLVGLP